MGEHWCANMACPRATITGKKASTPPAPVDLGGHPGHIGVSGQEGSTAGKESLTQNLDPLLVPVESTDHATCARLMAMSSAARATAPLCPTARSLDRLSRWQAARGGCPSPTSGMDCLPSCCPPTCCAAPSVCSCLSNVVPHRETTLPSPCCSA